MTPVHRSRLFALAGALAVRDLTPDESLELAKGIPVLLDDLRLAEEAAERAIASADRQRERAITAEGRLAELLGAEPVVPAKIEDASLASSHWFTGRPCQCTACQDVGRKT